MAYVKTNWVNGVTPENAANLNHIEQGIADADAAAAAAAAALAGKEDKSAKGAVSGYAPLDAAQKVPLANLPAMGADLSFDGDWAAGTYQDGDTVVKDGVTFLCVGGPTAVPPDPTLWGSLTGGIPAVQNGKWIKGAGGAMVWDNPTSYSSAQNINAANTDLTLPDVADVYTLLRVGTGGGSVRSIQQASGDGTKLDIQNPSSAPIALLHQAAGGPGGSLGLWLEGTDKVLPSMATAHLVQAAGSWVLLGITPFYPPSRVIGRNTTQSVYANDTVEHTLAIFGIPGGALGLDGIAHLVLNGSFRSQSTSDNIITYRIKLGGVTVWASQSPTYNNGAGTPDGEIFIEVFVQALGSQALQQVYGIVGGDRDTMGTQVGMGKPAGSAMAAFGSGIADSTVNLAAAQWLEITGQMSSGNNNNILRHRSSFLEIL